MAGADPPDPELTSGVFTAMQGYSYDSANWSFKSGTTLYYLFVERITGTPERCRWFLDTDAGGGVNPRCQIDSTTYNTIKNGTYSGGSIVYGGNTYHLRMYRDVGAGKQLAKAVL